MADILSSVGAWVVHLLALFSTTIIHIKAIWEAKEFGAIAVLIVIGVIGVAIPTYVIKALFKDSNVGTIVVVSLILLFVSGFVASYFDTIGKEVVVQADTFSIVNNTVQNGTIIPTIDLNGGST